MDLIDLMNSPVSVRSAMELDTYQIFNILRAAGSTLHHYQIRAAVERDFAPGEYGVRRVTSNAADGKAFDAYVLDSDQAAVLTGSFGGSVGVKARRALLDTIRAMRAEISQQAATITTLETEKAAARMILETQLPVALEQVDEASDLIAALPYSKNRQRLEDKWTYIYASLKAVRTKLAVTHGVTAPPLPEALRAEADAAEERRLNKTPINIPLQFGFSRGDKK